MGRLFLEGYDDPFRAMDDVLKKYTLGHNVQAIFVDIHAEATSEKWPWHNISMASQLSSARIRIFRRRTRRYSPKGTAFQTDAGMAGDYNSVIGLPDIPIQRFVRKLSVEKLTPATAGTVCGTFIETDDATGHAKTILPVRVGGRLQQTVF